jgi:hypothetical protein
VNAEQAMKAASRSALLSGIGMPSEKPYDSGGTPTIPL